MQITSKLRLDKSKHDLKIKYLVAENNSARTKTFAEIMASASIKSKISKSLSWRHKFNVNKTKWTITNNIYKM